MSELAKNRQDDSNNTENNTENNSWQILTEEFSQQSQRKSFQTHNEIVEMVKGNIQKIYNTKVEKLERLKEQLATTGENNSRMVNHLTRMINSQIGTIEYLDSALKRMRPNSEEDLKKRSDILNNYSKAIDEAIPDSEPIVFPGVNNIEVVKTIIESGGLKTPEERGADYKSFATQIDVTAKKNIRTSCHFADAGAHSFLPYGGLFVFYPKEHEKDNVLSAKDGTEVYGGEEGINLNENRFIGLITTEENINKMRIVSQ